MKMSSSELNGGQATVLEVSKGRFSRIGKSCHLGCFFTMSNAIFIAAGRNGKEQNILPRSNLRFFRTTV